MRLSEKDQALLGGEMGPAARMAMSILVRMAQVWDAREMLDITRAHIDATIYVGDAGLEFAERLASLGGRVAVPSTVNVSGLDEHHWKEWPVPEDWAEKAHRQMIAYQKMGTIPIWTCAPYQTEHAPKLGEQIAWGESNAVAFANSVLGARTERYPDYLDIAAALIGRVPAAGLHLEENRHGQLVLDLASIPESLATRDDFYPVLGHFVGKVSSERIPVVASLNARPTEDQLKALGASAASSGSVALFHIVGVTPEAPTLEEALHGRSAEETRRVTLEDLRNARGELETATGEELDLVVLGSPHFSFEEFRRLAPLLEGRVRHSRTTFLVTTSRVMRDLAGKAGFLRTLEAFGGRVTVDTCILATPMLPKSVRRLMTSSGKYALYSPGLLGVEVAYGSLEDCVSSAAAGRISREPSVWEG
ncbi:MAG: aconitase X [Vicinamibacteria bacterium]